MPRSMRYHTVVKQEDQRVFGDRTNISLVVFYSREGKAGSVLGSYGEQCPALKLEAPRLSGADSRV